MALVRAGSYWLDRYALAYSTDGRFAGLSYTDVEARLPVLSLLILIALLSVVLFLVNIRRRGWGLPAVAVGLWALVSIVMGGIYPLVVQRLRVDPVETTREAHLRRAAPRSDQGGLQPRPTLELRTLHLRRGADQRRRAGKCRQSSRRCHLLDPAVSAQTFELEQVERSFFRFDEDQGRRGSLRHRRRGHAGRDRRARAQSRAGIPESGWESEVLSFTHGNGVALALRRTPSRKACRSS